MTVLASDDRLARILEFGLAALLFLAPLPFGAVVPAGRMALELGSGALLLLWLVRAASRPTPLPSALATIGLAGLLLLGTLQAAPLGSTMVRVLSPLSMRVRTESAPSGLAIEAEQRILATDPASLDPPPALSLDPPATASAVRTGAALAALFFVACTVAATRGGGGIALALLTSAAFQALYGIATLASTDPHIWHLPKKYYLDCATGTLVNRNHFAGLLAACLPCGLALVVSGVPSAPPSWGVRRRIVAAFDRRGSRAWFLTLLLVLASAGLLLSFSRAGIGLAAGAVALTILGLRPTTSRSRLLGVALAAALALVPVAQIGAERWAERFAQSGSDFSARGGRATVWQDTLRMIGAAPLVGIGFGAFGAAYPTFRSPDVRAKYDHAHNDALQVVAEGGLVAALLLIALLLPLAREIPRSLRGGRGPIAVGIAAGLTAMLGHALIDFGFHIPSNAAVAAALAGALSGFGWNDPV